MSGIEWNGPSFSIVYDTTWSPSGGTGTLVERFDGRVSPNGRKIETLTYSYDGDVDIPANQYSQAVFYRYDCTITINNLDIEEVLYGMVHYSEAGPATGERVSISFRSESQGPTPGEPVSTHEYTHTNWNNPEDYPYLDVYFLE